jgi:hypothetical protein
MIINADKWYNGNNLVFRKKIVERILMSELTSNTISNMINKKEGKLPPRMMRYYRGVLSRSIAGKLDSKDIPEGKILKMPMYDTDSDKILLTLQSAIVLLCHCYPAIKLKNKNSEDVVMI